MKTERVAPWVFITAAVLVFFLFILVTAQITSVLASTSRFQLNAKTCSCKMHNRSTYPC